MCHPYRLSRLDVKFVIVAQGPAEATDSIPVDMNDLKHDGKFALK